MKLWACKKIEDNWYNIYKDRSYISQRSCITNNVDCRKWSYPKPGIFYLSFSIFLDLYQRWKFSFFLIYFLVRARDSLYRLWDSKLFLSPETDVESNIIKCDILISTSGTVSCGNRLFYILGIVPHGYSGWYPTVTVWLDPRKYSISYTPEDTDRIWWTNRWPR